MPSAEVVSRTAFAWGFLPLLFFSLSYYYPFVRDRLGRRVAPKIESRRMGSGVRAFIDFNRSWSRDYVRFWRRMRRPAFAAFVVLEFIALVAWVASL